MKYNKSNLNTTESFIGESLEEKIRRVTETGAPIEAVSAMYYNERKDGVQPGTNIRTDKFDIALQAMTNIAEGVRQKRYQESIERSKSLINEPTNVSDKP